MNSRIEKHNTSFLSALSKLEEVILLPENEIHRDASIKRFEFTFELFWKLLKLKLEIEGIEANSPRKVFQEAYKLRWILEEEIFLKMLQDRNETSHAYQENVAIRVYKDLKLFTKAMREIIQRI